MISTKGTSLWASPWSLTPVLLKAKPWMWFWRWPKMFTCWTPKRVLVDSWTYALPKKSTIMFSRPQIDVDAHLAPPLVCSKKRTSTWSLTLWRWYTTGYFVILIFGFMQYIIHFRCGTVVFAFKPDTNHLLPLCFNPFCSLSPRMMIKMRSEWNCHGWDVELKKASNFLVWRLITCNSSPVFSPLNGKSEINLTYLALFVYYLPWFHWLCFEFHGLGHWWFFQVFRYDVERSNRDSGLIFSLLGIRLRPSYAEKFYHVLPNSSTAKAPKVLLLAGDAAISHHFWPGRGLNTGLKSAAAIVRMRQMNDPFCRLNSMVLVLSPFFSGFQFEILRVQSFENKNCRFDFCFLLINYLFPHIWGNSWRRTAQIQWLHGHFFGNAKICFFLFLCQKVLATPGFFFLWQNSGPTALKQRWILKGLFCRLTSPGFAEFPEAVSQDKLRQREMQGRSASMMRKEMRLPWAGTLLSPTSSEGQQFKKLAVEQDQGPSEKRVNYGKIEFR